MRAVMAQERDTAGLGSREERQLGFHVEGPQRRLPEEHEEALFRIAQEALHDVVRHAHAHCVAVGLDFAPDVVALTITDDGDGPDDLHRRLTRVLSSFSDSSSLLRDRCRQWLQARQDRCTRRGNGW
jgi:signal transduction histidine kinase